MAPLYFLADQPALVRPKVVDNRWHFFDGALQTWEVSSDADSFTSGQLFKANSPHSGAGRGSTATPPYHRHEYQTETFHVQKGRLCYFVNGRSGKLEAGEKYVSKAGEWHTFWNDPSTGEDMEVHITVRGGDNPGFDEIFVHNFYGYLSAKTMAGLKPDPFQMLLFMWSADVVIADAPGAGIGLGWWANYLLGYLVGGKLLGYQEKYKVFDD